METCGGAPKIWHRKERPDVALKAYYLKLTFEEDEWIIISSVHSRIATLCQSNAKTKPLLFLSNPKSTWEVDL